MNKYLKFTILLMFSFYSCISDVKIGIPSSTYNIEQSKKASFFIEEYISSKREFQLNDTVYKIKEVWSEYAWQYKNTDMEEEKLDYINFLISFNQDDIVPIKCIGGMEYTNQKMRFRLTKEDLKLDTIKRLFLIKGDTIPVLFVKKK